MEGGIVNMGKKLAIKGHPTRGKEVIELLEMMGGKNNYKVDGVNINCTYIIRHFDHSIIGGRSSSTEIVFTLEEFLEKYPFKINDKVIDKADGCPGVVCEMKWDEDVSDMKYCVAFGNGIDFGWFANDSIEFCKENKNLKENKFPSFEPMFKMNDELEYMVPDGYEITEASKDKVFIKPIKPKYPATYGECCRILEIDTCVGVTGNVYNSGLINSFVKLKICRDAYWKIAGEELGLGKPWEPKFGKYIHYSINFYLYKDSFVLHKGEYSSSDNRILVFPTEEMRDAFYDNFSDLIEYCKELL